MTPINAADIVTVTESVSTLAKNNPELYNDLAKSAVQNLGKSLCTVTNLLNTCLVPIELINETVKAKKEKFLKDYTESLYQIPEEKICEPNFALVGPIVEKLKFKITEDVLREKYAKLIASASNAENLTKPLLSFDNVLEQITPYEVELLQHLFQNVLHLGLADNIPIADIVCFMDVGYLFPFRNLTGISFKNLDTDTISVILSNFERLGLIYIDKRNYTEPVQEKYRYIFESEFYKNLEKTAEEQRKQTGNNWPRYDVKLGHFTLTDFGMSFVQTVIV